MLRSRQSISGDMHCKDLVRTRDTKVAHRVVGHKIDHVVELDAVGWLCFIQSPQPVQPAELKELLRKEKTGDHEWIG